MEKQNLSKELLPPVFGSKLKVICFSCKQLSVLVEPPNNQVANSSSSGSVSSTPSNASFASSSNFTNNNDSKISI
jgi:hypothetical protein